MFLLICFFRCFFFFFSLFFHLSALFIFPFSVSLTGADLKGAKYSQPFSETELPFVPGSHVTAGKGTGLVHTAPAHGPDDFQIALLFKLSVVSTVSMEEALLDQRLQFAHT